MLFNSLHFCLFFPVVTAFYFALPHRVRWAWLLQASTYFYMVFVPIYVLILAVTIVIDYVAGRVIEGAKGRRRLLFLVCSVVANVGILLMFKYYNFFITNIGSVAHVPEASLPLLRMTLPIGLSFHTFQAMSYTIEVFRGRQAAERHLGIYALYVMFYPQLVAGPIERPQNLIHQFREEHTFDYQRVKDGLRLMAWGFIKKVVVADRLAQVVNIVYGEPTRHQGAPLIVATYFFAIQIYCDFSGYSDIALGAAEVMGFRLMKNFNQPYASQNISEFWRRWHISLSTWFRDYIYIPLRERAAAMAGVSDYRHVPLDNPRAAFARYRDLAIIFLISGLWHGANWTFLVWGALHASYVVVDVATRDLRERLTKRVWPRALAGALPAIRTIVVFHLVTFTWIFFRANSLSDARHVASHLFRDLSAAAFGPGLASSLGTGRLSLLLSVALVVGLQVIESRQAKTRLRTLIDAQPTWIRWGLYYSALAAILFLGEFEQHTFIYFQF